MLTLIRCPFHPRVTAVARKRLQSFCQKCRWQVTPLPPYTLTHTHTPLTHTPLTQRSRSGLTVPLSRLAEPLSTDPGLKSGISAPANFHFGTNKQKRRRGMNGRTFSPNPRKRGKGHRHVLSNLGRSTNHQITSKSVIHSSRLRRFIFKNTVSI